MRLWNIGRSKSGAGTKYVPINDSHDLYTIHLFRSLLRETGYLPDAAARTYLHRHIVSRFRQYHPKKTFAHSASGTRMNLVEHRRASLFKTARKGLTLLHRANDGHPRHLTRILAMTYGRIGWRRHKYLQPLMIPDVPSDQSIVEKMVNATSARLPQMSRRLQALVKSHATKKLPFHPARPTLAPKIPEKNAWGRPMPIRRVRNIIKRWYSETIHRIMPPLPETEWKRLQGLASGHMRWEGPVLRRGLGRKCGFKQETIEGNVDGRYRYLTHPHHLTARYMRRMWTKVFAQCPLMKPDESRKLGWDVQWGDIKGSKNIILQSRPTIGIVTIFEGVDAYGKVLSKS